MIEQAIAFLGQHADLFGLAFDLLTNKQVDKAKLMQAMKDTAVEASDAEMHREFPGG
jgi:hypothetical protein